METWLVNKVEELFKNNPLSSRLDINILSLGHGEVTMSMPITNEIHTNVYGFIHGGSFSTLADSVMGVACLTVGKLVVTSDMSVKFISNSKTSPEIIGLGKIIHNGKNLIITEAEIRDKNQHLLVKAQGSYFVQGSIEKASLL
ncbi:MAG: phenylacetic acid degradation-related protein [Firmicutes bacterium]|nr:phenylacetic acid degradation-related protein [Bacillota bacterium]